MTKTATPVPKVDAAQAKAEIVAQGRAQIAAAKEARVVAKEAADRVRDAAHDKADSDFVAVINEWRAKKVPWKDIEAATGLTRQGLGKLLRKDAK